MLQKIHARINSALQQENLAARSERMLPAALYGALVAATFTLTNALVNVYSFPGLPLGLDWGYTLGVALGAAAAFALAGAIAGWFIEEYSGIVAGGAIITALLAIVFLFQLGADNGALTLQSILMAIPLVGVSMLVAGALRWTARRHLEIIQKETVELRPRRLAGHILLVMLVGLVIGILGRMDLPAEQTLTKFHKFLQAAPTDQSVWVQLPVKQVPALPEHFGVDYRFYVRRSEFALGALDVKVHFADGFKLNCVFSVGESNFFTECQEGN